MIGNKLIKVCGMRQAENIREVEALGIDLMGFIFVPRSPRFVAQRPDYLPTHAQRIGVFVNETPEVIERQIEAFQLQGIQLHGDESPEICQVFHSRPITVIKAFSVACADDLARTSAYEGTCDYFLFDTPCDQRGGSGRSFNWDLLQAYQGKTPFFLSGGLHPESARDLQQFDHPRLAGYDLNSRFESAPGEKEVPALEHFLTQLSQQTSLL